MSSRPPIGSWQQRLQQRLRRSCTLAISSTSDPEKQLVLADGLLRYAPSLQTKYLVSNCKIKTALTFANYDNLDSYVEITLEPPSGKFQNGGVSSTATIRLNRDSIKTVDDEPALVECRQITMDDAGEMTKMFGFDNIALQSYIDAAGLYARPQSLFLVSVPFVPYPPSQNLMTRGGSHGFVSEDVTRVQEAFKSSGTVHALFTMWEPFENVNLLNSRISEYRACDPLSEFFGILGIMKPNSGRPKIAIDKQSLFSSWREYQVIHECALLEEQEIAERLTGARVGSMRLISIPNTGNTQYFSVLQHEADSKKLSEGDAIRVCMNCAEQPDFHEAASWKATVISKIPFAPANSTSLILYREFLEDEGIYDEQEVECITMDTITSIADSRVALKSATPIPVAYMVEMNTGGLSRLFRSLRQLCQPEHHQKYRWAHTALLGHNIMNEPSLDLFKGIDNDHLASRAMNLIISRLNQEQKSAVNMTRSLPSGIGIVQGPPGTGKTFMIANLVQPLVWATRPHKGPAVLILSTSNLSVDDLTERVRATCAEFAGELSLKRKLIVIRVHSNETESRIVRRSANVATSSHLSAFATQDSEESAAAKALSSAYKMAQHKPFGIEDKRLRLIECSLGKLMLDIAYKEFQGLTTTEKEVVRCFRAYNAQFKAGTLGDEDMEKFQKAQNALRDVAFSKADIIVTTLSNSGTSGIRKAISPKAIIVDEAARASDPDLLSIFAWYKKDIARIIVGDSCQLQPVADHQNPFREQLSLSALRRLQLLGYPFVQLCEQRRSPSPIMSVFSSAYYRGTLKTCADFEAKFKHQLDIFKKFLSEKHGLKIPRSASLFQLARGNASQDASGSWFNNTSARVSIQAALDVMDFGVKASSIAILTPYAAQTSLYLATRAHLSSKHAISALNIETFDSIQGREFDYTIVDFVRTDGLGFLSEGNRVNVALSRARFGMIVVMHYDQLRRAYGWKSSGLDTAMSVLKNKMDGNAFFKEEDVNKMIEL